MEPYFQQDGITIYHADCADILPSIDPADVGLLLTDPPYGIAHNTNLTRFSGQSDYAPIYGDGEPFDPTELLRFGSCGFFGANYFSHLLPAGRWIVWNKRDRMEHKPLMSDAELVWHNLSPSVPVETFNWYWNGAYRTGEMGRHFHPTQKPVSLMRWIVERWTQPGDLVLDPYMGSGPVAEACLQTGRRYIGIEIEEQYCQITVERRLNQMSLFNTTTGN